MRGLKENQQGITYLEVIVSIAIALMCLQTMGMGINFYSQMEIKNQHLESATYDAERLLREVTQTLSSEWIERWEREGFLEFEGRYKTEDYSYSIVLIPMNRLWEEREVKSGTIEEEDFVQAKYFASEGGITLETVYQQFIKGELSFKVNKVKESKQIKAKEDGMKYLIVVSVGLKSKMPLEEPKILKQMMGVKQVYG